jgi:oligosaccharide repeat unit polymerase
MIDQPRRPARPSPVDLVRIINAISLVVGVIMYLLAPAFVSDSFLWTAVLLGFSQIAVQVYYKRTLERPMNWVTIDLTVLTAFFLVHFVYIFLHLIDALAYSDHWRVRFLDATNVVSTTSAISVIGISAIALGFNLHREPPSRPIGLQNVPPHVFKNWCRLASVMIRSGAVFFVLWVLLNGVNVVFGSYAGSDLGGLGGGTLYQLCTGMLSIGICMAAIISVQHWSLWSKLKLDVLLAIVVIVLIILHGDRSTAAMIMFPLIFAISEYRRPFRFRSIVAVLLAAMFVFGVAGVARATQDRSPSGFFKAAVELGPDSIMRSVEEFSRSIFTSFAAVQYVPKLHDHYYGQMEISPLLGIIPFTRGFFGFAGEDYSSANLITKLILGPDSKSGTGTSMINEPYLDFGVAGVAIVLGLAGFVFRKLQTLARERPSILWGTVYGVAVGTMAVAARYSVVDVLVRQVLYPGLYLVIIANVMSIPLTCKVRQRIRTYTKRARA